VIPPSREALISRLTKEIDRDEPPGLAARILAAAVVELVRDRDGAQAALMIDDVRGIGAKHLRPRDTKL
jgi:hypothetical protein